MPSILRLTQTAEGKNKYRVEVSFEADGLPRQTATQFVAELYASLTAGHQLGDAVTIGRKQLAAQPLREIAYEPRALQDWPVPVVYEAAPIALFPKAAGEKKLTIKLSEAEATPARGMLDAKLPPSPDAGFFGRDETLLALDRAFDTQSIVLLHAYAGNGKTSTVAEFARWYSFTGGVDGPVLFTSFEQYKPLARVLDQIEQVYRVSRAARSSSATVGGSRATATCPCRMESERRCLCPRRTPGSMVSRAEQCHPVISVFVEWSWRDSAQTWAAGVCDSL